MTCTDWEYQHNTMATVKLKFSSSESQVNLKGDLRVAYEKLAAGLPPKIVVSLGEFVLTPSYL